MNPGLDSDFPDGEIFRDELILAILASSAAEAEKWLERDIARIHELIALQSRRVAEFYDDLPQYLEALPKDGRRVH